MIRPEFDQQQLHHLRFSKNREILMVNKNGSYCSTSVSTCNTRKYHGLLVSPQPKIDSDNHVLLSCLDDTVIYDEKEFRLSVHQSPGVHQPEGYLLMESFTWEGYARWTYNADGIIIAKELILDQNEDRVFIRYFFSRPGAILRVAPFIACRNIHTLRAGNHRVNVNTENGKNGLAVGMPGEYAPLHFQVSLPSSFIRSPDWYDNIEYEQEQLRGYEFRESLFVPGYLEVETGDAQEVVFCAGIKPMTASRISRRFFAEKKSRKMTEGLDQCLDTAASLFIVKKKQGTEIVAGWPWFGHWGRDTFIALPGLTLTVRRAKIFESVMQDMLRDFRDGLFPNTGRGKNASYNAADTSLWFIRALQQYTEYTRKPELTWKYYHEAVISVLENYRSGMLPHIAMQENGLLRAEKAGKALTWMDAIVDGHPVTQRNGLAVELNALWYNAICFALYLAGKAGNAAFINDWKHIPRAIEKSFPETFWSEEKGYLADCVNDSGTDWSLRPNQVIAVALPFCPVGKEISEAVLAVAEKKLLTPRGLRTLSPGDPCYKGIYAGNPRERDLAYHQGTVWPWLLGYYAEACLRVRGKAALEQINILYHGFEDALYEYGIETIPEIYDGDEPHRPKGCIAQAWSTGELLRVRQMLRKNGYKPGAEKTRSVVAHVKAEL
ncbi:MAG TPA: amylo-alpha-1,6-glucosidase [Bacteroidia bacterium]|nr:amylo-alpha-1,6-glucosidase [Bacteroidia bacterium]